MSEFSKYIKDGWKRRAEKTEQARQQERVKLLPAGLAEQIIEACDRERQGLQERIAAIDLELGRMDRELAEARIAEQDAADVYPQAPIRRRRLEDDTIVELAQPEIRIRGTAAITAAKRIRGLDKYRARLQAERVGRLGQIQEVGIVEKQARAGGVVSGLLAITSTWKNEVGIGKDFLPGRVPGPVLVDAAGQPLEQMQAEVQLAGTVNHA